jgi:hypothetical protein
LAVHALGVIRMSVRAVKSFLRIKPPHVLLQKRTDHVN